MGPLQQGILQFSIESQCPDYTKIPTQEDLLGISALIISASFKW